MKSDRILEEVWKAKDALGKQFGYDVHRLAEHFRRPEEITGGHRKPKSGRVKSKTKRISAKHNGNGHL